MLAVKDVWRVTVVSLRKTDEEFHLIDIIGCKLSISGIYLLCMFNVQIHPPLGTDVYVTFVVTLESIICLQSDNKLIFFDVFNEKQFHLYPTDSKSQEILDFIHILVVISITLYLIKASIYYI